MSTLKADTIQSTSGGAATLTKQEAAKAWVNVNHRTIATLTVLIIAALQTTGRVITQAQYHRQWTILTMQCLSNSQGIAAATASAIGIVTNGTAGS